MKKFIGFLFLVGLTGGVILVRDPTILRKAIAQVETGPNLKVWTTYELWDRTASGPLLLLNVQNRGDVPVTLTGASVNDDPKCLENGGPNMGFVAILAKAKGYDILTNGYSKTLKLGEVEKLLLGSPQVGGCTPVKAVINTDHGSSSFTFE